MVSPIYPQKKSEKTTIFEFSAQDTNGEPVWYFLAVLNSRCEPFEFALDQRVDLDMARFGKILASGKGKKAPEWVRAEVTRRYAAGNN